MTPTIEIESEIPADSEFNAKLIQALKDKEVRKALESTIADEIKSNSAMRQTIMEAV